MVGDLKKINPQRIKLLRVSFDGFNQDPGINKIGKVKG